MQQVDGTKVELMEDGKTGRNFVQIELGIHEAHTCIEDYGRGNGSALATVMEGIAEALADYATGDEDTGTLT